LAVFEIGLFTKLATPPILFKYLFNAYQSVCLSALMFKSKKIQEKVCHWLFLEVGQNLD